MDRAQTKLGLTIEELEQFYALILAERRRGGWQMWVCEQTIGIRPMECIHRIFSRTLHDPPRNVCRVHLDERPVPVFIIEPC